MTYTLGTVEGRGIRSVNYIYTESGVTLTVTLTDDTTTEFTIPKGDKGDTGDTGVSITGVELVSRTGLTDLYVIRFSDGTSTNFSVTNGRDAVVDSSMDSSSTNALENRVITNELVGIHSDLDTKFNEKDILQLLHDYGYASDSLVTRITLESDKDILSYADGDTATLTATAYDTNDNGVANQIVVFYKDGKVLDTGVTDTNGEATYEYESAGVGDIVFGASVGSLFIETYSIEDCIKYFTNVWESGNTASTSDINFTLPDSPFKLEFIAEDTGITSNNGYVQISLGQSDINRYIISKARTNSILYLFNNSSSAIELANSSSYSSLQSQKHSLTYENGVWTLFIDNIQAFTINNTVLTPNKISKTTIRNGKLSNLKIKSI